MLKLERLLGVIVCAFAVALSFRISYAWGVLIAGLVVWFIWKIVRARAGLRFMSFGPFAIPLLVYAIVVTISGAGRIAPELGPLSSKEVLANFATLRIFVVYFWAFDVFSACPRFRAPAVLCMLLAASLAGFVAVVQQIRHLTVYLQGTGFYSEPMAFSGVMQVFSLLSLAVLVVSGFRCFRRPFNNLLIYLLIVVGNVAGLIFSSERSAWLGFFVALVALSGLISKRLIVAVISVLTLTVSAAWFLLPVVKTRLRPLFTGEDPGLTSRVTIWRRAYSEFLKSPVAGVGTTKFPHLEIKDATVVGKPYLAHAHSNVLQLLSTAGILGLCSYLFVIVSGFVFSIQHLLRHTPGNRHMLDSKQLFERGVAMGLFAALASLAVSGLAEYNFGTGQVRFVLWFALALLGSEARR